MCSSLLESKVRIRDEELQAAVSDRNSLLAGDSMRVGYHGCVRGTAIGLGARRDRGLKLGRAKRAIQMYDECCHTVGCHQAVCCKFIFMSNTSMCLLLQIHRPNEWSQREETAWKQIKTSLVVVMLLLRVMTYVVFYKRVWN